jgi:hypothetical protein
MIFVDNNTDDPLWEIELILKRLDFPVPVFLQSHKHQDPTKTHSWSTNVAVKEVQTPLVFFTRADYLLAFDVVERFVREMKPNSFVTSNGCHLSVDLATCEQAEWRKNGIKIQGDIYDYTCIDTGVWLTTKEAFDFVGGLNEDLNAWGHAQTHFQWKLHNSGVEFVRIPEVLFFHQQHGGDKDMALANRQVIQQGLSLQEMWARYEGPRIY